MNQPDPAALAEEIAECSTGNGGEAFGENPEGLLCAASVSAEEATVEPTPAVDQAPVLDPAAAVVPPVVRRRKRRRWVKRTGPLAEGELVQLVLLAIKTAEAYREKAGHYGRGAEYLPTVHTGWTRRNLARGINLAVDLGLIRLELCPVPSKIRRFFSEKCPSTHGKTTEKQGV